MNKEIEDFIDIDNASHDLLKAYIFELKCKNDILQNLNEQLASCFGNQDNSDSFYCNALLSITEVCRINKDKLQSDSDSLADIRQVLFEVKYLSERDL